MNQKEMVVKLVGMGWSLEEAIVMAHQGSSGITGFSSVSVPVTVEPAKPAVFDDLLVDALNSGNDTRELGDQHKHMKGLLTATVVTALTHEDSTVFDNAKDQTEFNTNVNKLFSKILKDKLADKDGKVLNRAGKYVDAWNADGTVKYKDTAYASTFETAIKFGMWVFRVMNDLSKTQAEAIDAVTCEKSIGGTSYLTLKSRAKIMEMLGTDFESYLKNQFDVVLVGVLRKIESPAMQKKAKELIEKFAKDAPAIIGVPKPTASAS